MIGLQSDVYDLILPGIQPHLYNCVQDINILVLEGGPKQQKKMKQLMMSRIK